MKEAIRYSEEIDSKESPTEHISTWQGWKILRGDWEGRQWQLWNEDRRMSFFGNNLGWLLDRVVGEIFHLPK